MNNIYILDIKGTNTANILNTLKDNFNVQTISHSFEIKEKNPNIVLPGNGSFGYYVDFLRQNEWRSILKEIIYKENSGKLLCICSGFQVLGISSEESPGIKGLGLIGCTFHSLNNYFNSPLIINIGRQKIYESTNSLKLKQLNFTKKLILRDLMNPYFVHGYAAELNNQYLKGGKNFCYLFNKINNKQLMAGIISNNFCATQFHPELSGIFWKDFMLKFFN